jgi:hypothetical protein
MVGSVPKMDELIDTVKAVEIVDGVRARLTAPWVIEIETVSDSIIGGEGVAACVSPGIARRGIEIPLALRCFRFLLSASPPFPLLFYLSSTEQLTDLSFQPNRGCGCTRCL